MSPRSREMEQQLCSSIFCLVSFFWVWEVWEKNNNPLPPGLHLINFSSPCIFMCLMYILPEPCMLPYPRVGTGNTILKSWQRKSIYGNGMILDYFSCTLPAEKPTRDHYFKSRLLPSFMRLQSGRNLASTQSGLWTSSRTHTVFPALVISTFVFSSSFYWDTLGR